jgi:hypothetical protein
MDRRFVSSGRPTALCLEVPHVMALMSHSALARMNSTVIFLREIRIYLWVWITTCDY